MKAIYLILTLIFLLSFSPNVFSQDEQPTEKPKKEFLGGLKGKFKRKKKETTGEGQDNASTKKKRKFSLFKRKGKDDGKLAGKEKKWKSGQNLTDEESEKVEDMMEKYKLTDDERYIKSMYKAGEPFNTKGKKKLKKVHRKESKLKKKQHKFHIKRNLKIQDKETKKRMKKNRKKANKRTKKRYR